MSRMEPAFLESNFGTRLPLRPPVPNAPSCWQERTQARVTRPKDRLPTHCLRYETGRICEILTLSGSYGDESVLIWHTFLAVIENASDRGQRMIPLVPYP